MIDGRYEALPSVACPRPRLRGRPALAQPGDWGVTRDPFDKTVVARYKAILAKNPHDATALARLLEMYRRYKTVDLLKDEYQKTLDKDAEQLGRARRDGPPASHDRR